MSSSNVVQEYLQYALTGSLVIQRAQKCGYDKAALDHASPEELGRWMQQWTTELTDMGLSSVVLARAVTDTLLVVLSAEQNRALLIRRIATVLWSTLGDPSSGDPPDIYYKAAFAVWHSFMVTLDPDYEFQP